MHYSPLGSNIIDLSDWDLATYSNRQVIAINQDPLGKQGAYIHLIIFTPILDPNPENVLTIQ